MKKLLIYSVLMVAAVACKQKSETAASTSSAPAASEQNVVMLDSLQKKNAGIVTATAQEGTTHATIRATGSVDVPPQSLISVSFPLGGYLKSTTLLPGSPISKGQVIAVMEDPAYVQLQQDYLTAKARMQYLATDMQRQRELSEADATSKKSYQLALSEYNTQEVMIQSLAAKLRIIHINPDKLSPGTISGVVPIYAPINGYVSKVNVNIGKYVNPADVLFELVNPDDIHAAITVFEKNINSFKKGMHGKVSLVDKPDEWYDVETILVTRNVDENRSGVLHCHFEKQMLHLLPGMFLNAVFELDNKPAAIVPEDALVRYNGKEYVFTTADENSFHLVRVTAGDRENGKVALLPDSTDWLKTKIVVQGAYALLGKLKNRMEE
ncbi:efflux RND transporter periplasmic adaptor subunit [Chitinophaga ginsengisegetis]|uniref:efflux RND transporter periplasmic adaptor subunit n=1 Tax=Chitinophaga ginsengisegetis TaxID=393003 RepID=UPI000DB9FB7C|nr:efflux RND transporter periplasmic adaptor subunit [Chitinophaga ginsengisegetis]MDR6570636.1 cobalt-zinc-cadmium efflux system membrane fusion protein [Chitinophaga ginsengisegetis]MDR6650370.1 cobalt-zinc-cadmium efflux system membrane fusion protein [Chitinophaga ginsengisegetis]MDR6656511.1 cobalt-zinc-cadmium efflux system membrane fusion protein [Chitinophaga ginsengisegetis]